MSYRLSMLQCLVTGGIYAQAVWYSWYSMPPDATHRAPLNVSCLQALASRHILSAPVMTGRAQEASQGDGAMQFSNDRDVVGFLDIRDILLNFLSHLGHVKELLQMPMLKRMHELEAAGSLFSRKLVSDIHAYGTDGNFLHSGRVCPCAVTHVSSPLSGRWPHAASRGPVWDASVHKLVRSPYASKARRHLHAF